MAFVSGAAHRIFVWTIGCQMNKADSERITREFIAAGHQPVETLAEASAVVLNGCAVRAHADQKVWGMLGLLQGLKKQKPYLLVGLTGCTVHADRAELAPHLAPVDVLFDTLNTEPMLAAMARGAPAGLPAYEDTEAIARPGAGAISRYVNVIYGCDKRCTYCIVPFRRGAQRSRPIPEILADVQRVRDEGAREIVLLGQIVNAYGFDMDGTTLADLLAAVDAIDGIERIRFTTAHPRYLTDDLADAMRDIPSVCEEINLPVQAGDDTVLKRMARGYRVADFRAKVDRLRERVPGIALSTDVIVGFCGETPEQFANTLRLIEEMRFDQVHVAAFSPRPGTVAAEWVDDVDPAEKMRRLHAVDHLQTGIAREVNEACVGQLHPVLLEKLTPSKEPDGVAKWRGRTRTNKLVFTPGHVAATAGATLPVEITAATPWSLRGVARPAVLA